MQRIVDVSIDALVFLKCRSGRARLGKYDKINSILQCFYRLNLANESILLFIGFYCSHALYLALAKFLLRRLW